MKPVVRILVLLFLFSPIVSLYAQSRTVQKRLQLAMEFGQVLQQGKLSNEEIMKRYVAKGYYFKDDTVKRVADFYLNMMRQLQGYTFRALKYSEHSEEFAVQGVRPMGDTSQAPRPMQFSLIIGGKNPQIEHPINIDDLYVLKNKREGSDEDGDWFILFDKKNKIIAFAGMTFGDTTGLMKF